MMALWVPPVASWEQLLSAGGLKGRHLPLRSQHMHLRGQPSVRPVLPRPVASTPTPPCAPGAECSPCLDLILSALSLNFQIVRLSVKARHDVSQLCATVQNDLREKRFLLAPSFNPWPDWRASMVRTHIMEESVVEQSVHIPGREGETRSLGLRVTFKVMPAVT